MCCSRVGCKFRGVELRDTKQVNASLVKAALHRPARPRAPLAPAARPPRPEARPSSRAGHPSVRRCSSARSPPVPLGPGQARARAPAQRRAEPAAPSPPARPPHARSFSRPPTAAPAAPCAALPSGRCDGSRLARSRTRPCPACQRRHAASARGPAAAARCRPSRHAPPPRKGRLTCRARPHHRAAGPRPENPQTPPKASASRSRLRHFATSGKRAPQERRAKRGRLTRAKSDSVVVDAAGTRRPVPTARGRAILRREPLFCAHVSTLGQLECKCERRRGEGGRTNADASFLLLRHSLLLFQPLQTKRARHLATCDRKRVRQRSGGAQQHWEVGVLCLLPATEPVSLRSDKAIPSFSRNRRSFCSATICSIPRTRSDATVPRCAANEGKKAARLVNHVSHGGVLLLGHPLLCLHSSLILGVLPFLCKHLVVVRMVAILHLSDGPVHAQRSALAGKIGPWVAHKWFGDRLKYRRSGDGSVQPSSGPARHVARKHS